MANIIQTDHMTHNIDDVKCTYQVPYPGLLESLKTPNGAWNVVTMDFINGLPVSSGYDCIMVIVENFSRYSHFIPLKHPFTPLPVAMADVKEIYNCHSLR
jgi:hypothetical protein